MSFSLASSTDIIFKILFLLYNIALKAANLISQNVRSDAEISRFGLESQDLGEIPESGHAGLAPTLLLTEWRRLESFGPGLYLSRELFILQCQVRLRVESLTDSCYLLND